MKGCSNHAVISELYHEYLQGVCSVVATGTAHGMIQLSSSATEEPKVDTRESERCCGMQGLSCRKKAKFDCEHKMCFNCCSALKQSSLSTWNKCDGHLKARLRKEVEDRYIEEGMSSLGKKGRTTFYHYEEKFMKCGQTVVIWCIRDFLRKKRWHEDTLQQFERLHRTRNLLRRKNRNNVSCSNRKKSATASKGYRGIVDDDDPIIQTTGSSKGRRCRRIARDQSYEESEVEETIERIKVQGGVEGYVICNKQGQVLRRFPSMSLEDAEKYAHSMISLTSQARGVIRDLDPKNELRYLRIRAKKHEIMVAYDMQFLVIVIQRWSASMERTTG